MEEFGAKATFLWFQYGEEDDRSEILNLRYEMEESLDKEVFGACEREDGEMPESIYEGNETGRVLGGAMGAERVYLDVLIFDEEQFDHKIKDWAGKYPYTIYKSEFKQGAESERVL